MEAPEKIYLNPALDALTKALSEKTEDDVEYTRTDVFIEKVCKWLFSHFSLFVSYYDNEEEKVKELDRSEFIKKFRKAMEG